jgi:hypothetical protein
MLARTRRGERLIGRGRSRSTSVATAPAVREEISAKRLPASAPEATGERRDLDPPLDTAIYNCHCGFVFEAPVCTTIACPHCGDGQAW